MQHFGVSFSQVCPYSLQAPFAALGCLGDEEASLNCEVLHDNLRGSLPFQPEVMSAVAPLKIEKIPVLDSTARRSVFIDVYRKNSYLQDLYAHGNLTRIVKEYGIAPEHFWKLLQHFVTSLHRLEEGFNVLMTQDPALPVHELAPIVSSVHKRMAKVLKALEA